MNIKNIFDEFIKEASAGEVNAYFTYNIIFETVIHNNKITSCEVREGTLIPCLNIKNLDEFNNLLEVYVSKALNFYDLSSFEGDDREKVKMIIASLFANATFDDFASPIDFLNRRIEFFDNSKEENLKSAFIPSLKSTLTVSITKDKIYNETPYELQSYFKSDDEMFRLPEIKFGIAHDTLYVYAIQNSVQEKTSYVKKINRALYKVNDGFSDVSTAELKDVTASFLVVGSVILSYIQSKNISKIKISSMLIERWNAKRIAISKKAKYKNLSSEETDNLLKEQERIQSNLTEKFLRTFLRLSEQFNNVRIISYPYDTDSYLTLSLNGKLVSDNSLLNDISLGISDNVKHL